MSTWQTLGIVLSISVVISAALIFAMTKPLQQMLRALCEGAEGVQFWVVYTATMLFIVPLVAGIIFGMWQVGESAAEVAAHSLASVLVGAFVALVVIGMKLADMSRQTRFNNQRGQSAR